MQRDQRDEFEDDDTDLDGIIHQYNEDSELRRKINEMKKQKETKQEEPVFDPKDSALVGNVEPLYVDTKIPDIRMDEDIEKTRVGFQDDRDKTLVIMGGLNKNETPVEDAYEDYSYADPQTMRTNKSEFHDTDEDLRETIKEKKKDKQKSDDVEDEKTKKINKTITIVIISIISLLLIVGIGFGVKSIFFSDKKEAETETDTKKNTTKKNTKKKTDKDKADIDDNSAKIKQLNAQLDSYESQLETLNSKIATTEYDVNYYQGKLSAIPVLKTNMDAAAGKLGVAKAKLDEKTDAKTTACQVSGEDCDKATTEYNEAKSAYDKANSDSVSSQSAYDTEYNQSKDYDTKLAKAGTTLTSLKSQKAELEQKIANTTTELNTYK